MKIYSQQFNSLFVSEGSKIIMSVEDQNRTYNVTQKTHKTLTLTRFSSNGLDGGRPAYAWSCRNFRRVVFDHLKEFSNTLRKH